MTRHRIPVIHHGSVAAPTTYCGRSVDIKTICTSILWEQVTCAVCLAKLRKWGAK